MSAGIRAERRPLGAGGRGNGHDRRRSAPSDGEKRRAEWRRCEGRSPFQRACTVEVHPGRSAHAAKQRVPRMKRSCSFRWLKDPHSALFGTLTGSLLVQAMRGPLCPLLWTVLDGPGRFWTVLDGSGPSACASRSQRKGFGCDGRTKNIKYSWYNDK